MSTITIQKRSHSQAVSHANFLTLTKASITTLAPVHLGSGEDFLPTNYVIDDEGWLHSFNEMIVAKALGSDLSQIAAIVEKRNAVDMLLSIQKLIHNKRENFRDLSLHSIPVAKGVVDLYKKRIGQVAQRESNNNSVVNKLEIMRIFTNPHTFMPIITGSAIKGAIRTAILNQLTKNKGWASPNHVSNATNLQKDLIGYQQMNDDPFKLLKISDAPYHNADNLLASEVLFAVSKRRKVKIDKNGNVKQGNSGLTTNLEAISPFRYCSFDFDIRLQNNPSQDVHNKIPKTTQEIAELCNAYYRPKLEKELRELGFENNFLEQNYVNGLEKLLEGELGLALQQNTAFLLNLGKHGGAYNKTLDNLRQIKMPKSDKPASEPTEKRLAATQSGGQANHLLPFGWVVVQLDDLQLPDLKMFIEEQATARHATKQKEDLDTLRQNQHNAKQKFAEVEAERIKLAQEKARLAEQAEAQRLQREQEKANMSEQQRQIANLQDEVEKTTQAWTLGVNHPIVQKLNQLIESTSTWSLADKTTLLDVAKEIYQKAAIDVKKNAKVKKRLAMLRT